MKLVVELNRLSGLAVAFAAVFFLAASAWYFFSQPSFAAGEIVIQFPPRPIGHYLTIRPAADPTFDLLVEREKIAGGTIKIPAGCMIDLTLNFNGSQNTNAIRDLPKNLVRKITCRDLEIDDKAVADLCTMTEIVGLNLQGTDLTNEGMKLMAPLKKLRRLNISDTLVKDEGLAVLKNMPLLEDLNLSRVTLGEELPNNLRPLKNLQKLDICGTRTTDKTLMQLPGFEKLTSLIVRRNNVSDRIIDTVLKYKKLRTFDVTDTYITMQGLQRLKGLRELRTIILREARLRPGEKQALMRALPNVRLSDGSRARIVPQELFAPLH